MATPTTFEQNKRAVADRIDIVDLVSERVSLKRSGRRFVGLCPFHEEKTPSFTVSPDRASFKCFGCGKGGDVFTFVQSIENVSFSEALRMLADRAGVELSVSRGERQTGTQRFDLAKVNAWAAKYFRSRLLNESAGRAARDYVAGRGISDATAETFGLGLAVGTGSALAQAAAKAGFPLQWLIDADLVRTGEREEKYDTFRNRLMFPIRDATNRVVGFGGRTLGDDRAKYLNTRQNALFDKGRGLYGIDVARDAIARCGRAVVVEGYTDCLAAHQAGFAETVATLGTALTDSQVDMLRRYCEEIILLFDSDDAGSAAAERAIRVAFPRCVTVRLARIPDGKDPGEYLERHGPAEFSDLLNGAVDALEFKWNQTRHRFCADGSQAKQREAVIEFVRVVSEAAHATAVDAIQRGQMVVQVAHLLRMDRSDVARLMSGVAPRRPIGPARPGERVAAQPREAPLDGEQAAWVHLLEVALNEPALLGDTEALPDINRIRGAQDRRIATIAWALHEQCGEFRLSDVSSQCEEPQDVERVHELARRGVERGNFEPTFRLAVARLARAVHDDEIEQQRAKLLGRDKEEAGRDPSQASLECISDGARRYVGYVPRRLIRGRLNRR